MFQQCVHCLLVPAQSVFSFQGMEESRPRFLYRVKKPGFLALQTLWTDPSNRAFICFTISWIGEDWKMCSTLLNIRNCTDQHFGDNIAEWLEDVLSKMGVDVSAHSSAFKFALDKSFLFR